MLHRTLVVSVLLLSCSSSSSSGFTTAFLASAPSPRRDILLSLSQSPSSSASEEAQALLERARKMRQEVAELTGSTVEALEQESAQKKEQLQAIAEKAAKEREERAATRTNQDGSSGTTTKTDGSFLQVPETPDDQIWQAKAAVERAFRDGITRQIVRFALVPEGETLNQEDRQWPGGAQQMYREAAGPLTRDLLKQVKAPTKQDSTSDAYATSLSKQPTVKTQDIWDFDGSALVTAEHESPSADVQAMVLPNTDNKYTNDIATIDQAMGDRLFLLVNPFWRNVESWGFNLLAPGAKQSAQKAIFDRNFQETYCVLQKSVRGEDCVAVKAYPYDWQLYAYAETDYWPYGEYTLHLGSTTEEPTAADFGKLLEQRDEFKMSKNMRQMQRAFNRNNDE